MIAHDATPLGREEHDPRALEDLLRRVPVGEQPLNFDGWARFALRCFPLGQMNHIRAKMGSNCL